MEPTVCPWCQSEIVWDEEIGPEETCPHCANELKGYRTLSIPLGKDEDEDELDEDFDSSDQEEEGRIPGSFWPPETESLSSLRTIDKYGEDVDVYAFEESVEKLLDEQEEAPECIHCREYMLLAGTQRVEEGFAPVMPGLIKGALLKPPFDLKVYICPGCFQVHASLAEDDRLRLIRGLIDNKK